MIKQTISFCKKHDQTCFILFISICLLGISLNVGFGANDELWNFANIYKMEQGFQIYIDSNVIITPLFFYLGLAIFKILGANFFIFRLYNLAIYATLFSLIYLIFKALGVRKLHSFLYTLFIYILFSPCIVAGANYNILVLVFVFIGIYLLIKQGKKEEKSFDIIQGIVLFLIFMTKQNIVVLYALAMAVLKIVLNKEIKKTVKELLIQGSIALSLVVISAIFFYVNGNLAGLINYAFLGIHDFASNNIHVSIYSIYIVIIVSIIGTELFLVSSKKLSIEPEVKRNILICMVFSICLLGMAFPIFNYYHILCAILMTFLGFFFVIDHFFLSKLLDGSTSIKVIKEINLVICSCLIGYSLFHFAQWVTRIQQEDYPFTSQQPFFGTAMTEEQTEDIQLVCEYILTSEKQGKKVVLISERAMVYNTVLKRSQGVFDLPLSGNLGKDGPDGVIQKIQELEENTRILITTKPVSYQEVTKIKDFVKQNYEKQEEIGNFCVYAK